MSRGQGVVARLKGPVVPINVCFNEEGTVKYGAVGGYGDWLCEEKTGVRRVTAGSREDVSLSDREIWDLTATVAKANDGRSLFVASTGFWKPSHVPYFF